MFILNNKTTLSFFFLFSTTLAHATSDDRTDYQHFNDSVVIQSRLVNQESLQLLQKIHSIEKSLIDPERDQLIVLMKQDLGAQILLQTISLYIDNTLIKKYHYKGNDLEKLMSRGVLRLVTLLLPPGLHTVKVEMTSLNHAVIKRQLDFEKKNDPQFLSLDLVGSQIKLETWQSQ